MRKFIATILLLNAVNANATLTPSLLRGEKLIEIPITGRASEVCVIPLHMPGAEYSKKDLKAEQDLCAMQAGVNTAVCGKINSTNPGLNFFEVPEDMNAADIVAKDCTAKELSKSAKYKLSTSCSYTPSLLGYYHVSRMLGGAGAVPPAVLRTFDLQNHIRLGQRALKITHGLIHNTWRELMNQLQKGQNSKSRDLLFTDDFTQSYGALIENPKREDFYKEFFNGGTDRAATFRDKNAILAKLNSRSDVSAIAGREFNAANLQLMVQLKDASEMIVLDTILSQQDRFGNIHFTERYFYFDPNKKRTDGTPTLTSDNKMKDEDIKQLGAILIKRMILKDNDCGVAKEGRVKAAGLPAKIRHMDPEIYQRVLAFDAVADQVEVRKFFTQGLMFTSADYTKMRQNLGELAKSLRTRCNKGDLKLDLDLDRHFSGLPLKKQNCELKR